MPGLSRLLTHVCSLDSVVNENGVLFEGIFSCFAFPVHWPFPGLPTNNRSPQHCSGPASSRVTEETVVSLMTLADSFSYTNFVYTNRNSFSSMFSLLKHLRDVLGAVLWSVSQDTFCLCVAVVNIHWQRLQGIVKV